jgi:hypothetical protein
VVAGLRVKAAPRFLEAVARTGPKMTDGYYREIGEFLRRYASSPKTVSHTYDQAEHLKPEVVLEFEVGGGPRMLAHWSPPVLTLLDAGEHEVVGDYKKAWLASALEAAVVLDGLGSEHKPWSTFGSNRDTVFEEYRRELHPDWIYDLADHQAGAAASIRKAYPRTSRDNPKVFVLVGGPGTGKTSILVKLMMDLQAMGARPGIAVSDPVADFIEAGLGRSIAGHRLWPRDQAVAGDRFDVVLFDDPASLAEVDSAIDAAVGHARIIVVAFDPCQLDEDIWDDDYHATLARWDAKSYELKACYRQKQNLGVASLRVMERVAESTPFLDKRKIAGFREGHELVYRIANNLRFPNKHGYEHTYVDATQEDVRAEASRIRKLRLWHHVTPVLAAVDRSCELQWPWKSLLRDIPHDVVEFDPASRWSELRAVKGLEFQHVFLVINRALFDELESGFEGSGQSVYHARRMLRIPFSRAKDSLVTFVVESPANRAESRSDKAVRQAAALLRDIARRESH